MTSTPSTTAGFRRAFGWHDQAPQRLVFARGNGHRQGPLGRSHRTIEGQFAHDRVLRQFIGGHLSAADERAQGHGQVERGGVLWEVGGGMFPRVKGV